MPKYLDETGLAHYHGNVEKRPVQTFETVAAMQAATNIKAGMTCHTNGFHASGDGGAAYYTVSASGTANGMDVLALQGGLFATLVVTEPYVTPEQFGAWGDGTHDDAASIQSAINECINSEYDLVFGGGKNYLIGEGLYVTNASNLGINGNGCTLTHNYKNGIVIDQTSHGIAISNMKFIGKFEPNDSETPSNSCIVVSGVSDTALFEAHDISVDNCSFTCGVFGVVATNVQNLSITNCYFTGGVYRPEDSAGGYCILEQSCINVTVDSCVFAIGDYGRHDIYVSVRQPKTENRQSKNIYIHNCFSDRSNMSVQSSGAYFSSNTVRVAVRACVNLHIDGFYAIDGTGVVALNNADGEIRNATVENIISYNAKYISGAVGASESRMAIGLICSSTDNYFECLIKKLSVLNAATLFQDIQGQADIVHICDTLVNYQIQFNNAVRDTFLILENVGVKTIGALSYNGTTVLKGSFKNFYNASSNEVLTCGVCENNTGKISLECYEPESKICRIDPSGTAPTWMNNRQAHPYMTLSTVDGEYKKVTLPYCTKPRTGIYTGIGSGNLGSFFFDPTHDAGENSARLYSYNADGSASTTKYAQLMLV